MIRKRSIALLLALTMVLAIPMSVSAGTSSSYYNGKKVTANCGTKSSWHQFSGGSYPKGTGRFNFVYNKASDYRTTVGTSYSTYWYGSISPGAINSPTNAKTTYSGYVVTAIP
ncbi:hypothetical protein [Ruminococcus gauvreauii]|uniref:Lactococcin 972 family bacteriocin n=1 Tax=Ruminococcus gauvreauii TaxID=438033 RepID=A0ABY5VDK1_9FIRM|nr:hypothetical protein [Ruminococcus gauvreauii]UWP58664.1 hypothetical protein NQ502_14965 [Ruminococcus gauvreauii]